MRIRIFRKLSRGCSAAGVQACACLVLWGVLAAGSALAQEPAKQAEAAKPATAMTEKQKQLADDTAKLLTLANELKAEMDKTTKDTLSISVIRKAEEVEKLAHRVRDEMKAQMGIS